MGPAPFNFSNERNFMWVTFILFVAGVLLAHLLMRSLRGGGLS